MDTALYHFDRFMVWAWGPYPYPRWQRRTYILLWPLLMPLRWVLPSVIVAVGGVCYGIGFALYLMFSEVIEGLFIFGAYLKKQWA